MTKFTMFDHFSGKSKEMEEAKLSHGEMLKTCALDYQCPPWKFSLCVKCQHLDTFLVKNRYLLCTLTNKVFFFSSNLVLLRLHTSSRGISRQESKQRIYMKFFFFFFLYMHIVRKIYTAVSKPAISKTKIW